MIKCIFTRIKNEHRYLEAWINYHIKLGFNKFIIYQDKDSISHESIIDKYTDIVDIDFYDYLLNNDTVERKDIVCFKHIIENYNNIDWIINLNPDEYISMPEGLTIDDLLYNVDSNINQILFKWRIYNASSFIKEPLHDSYKIKDVYLNWIDNSNLATYFEKSSNIDYDNGKTILRYKYFLNNFRENLDINISENFPNVFIPYDYIESSKIYISYFVTKSFEEFYNKLINKETDKKIGDFFVVNPELISKIPDIENKFGINVFTL